MRKGLLMIAVFLFGFAVKGVAQADGEYYLYNAESECFLSHGDSWGTRAVVDKYGSPVLWTSTEGSLKFLDNNLCLFETGDNFFFTDNASTGFSFEETTDGYYLKSTQSGSYAMLAEGIASKLQQILLPTTEQASAAVWQLMTKDERDELVAGYVNENYANVAKAAGLNVTAEDFLKVLATAATTDMTSSIGTARFAGSVGDWTYTEVRHQDKQPAYGTDFCELWQATGSYTQVVTGLPEGIYKVTMNGFERAASNADCVTLGELGYEISTSALIANGEQVALKSWYSGQTGGNNPNSTGEAIAKFNEGKYLNEVYTYVGVDGQLTLTVDKHAHVGNNWVLFNNFTLTRYDIPFTPIELSPSAEEIANKLDIITLRFAEDVDVNDELKAVLTSKETGDKVEGVISYDYDDYTKVLITLSAPVNTAGEYQLTIPAGAIFAVEDETKTTEELTYTYKVDPDYWNPEWVMEISSSSQSSPVELIAGRKYSFSGMYVYMTYTATEDGRLYFTNLDDHSVDLSRCDETWYNMGDLAKTDDGRSWIGVQAGQTVYMNDYGFGARLYQVSFEPGVPYETLVYTGSFPADGGQYSKSTEAPKSYEIGAVEFYFNTKVNKNEVKVYVVLPANNKKIDVTEDVTLYDGFITWGKQPAYLAVMLSDIIDDIKSENDLKAGDAIQVVLENVQDLNAAANALTDALTVNLTLAATVCTSINPDPSRGVDGIPAELSLRFDGAVSCANGKGWIVDVKSGAEQEFAIENFATEELETWSGIVHDGTLTLPEPTIELTSKKFAIRLEGLMDDAGNVISYGDEVGKFVINYAIRDDNFNYVTVDPEDATDITSMKSVKLTFAEKAYIAPDAEAPYFWAGDTEITGTMAIDPNDENSVIITWSEEVTAAGAYYPTIPSGAIYNSKFDASKEDYGLADGASYNPYISLEYYIPADVSATTVASITPASYAETYEPINSLPAEVVIEFNGNVKEVVNAYGERPMWSIRGTDVPEDATPLEAKLVDNKVVVTIPADVISAISFGEFAITVNAIGEDGKPIGTADDPYAENITFTYYVYKTLQLVESTPADGETVKELSTITMTFDAPIATVEPSMYDSPAVFDLEWNKVADLDYTFSGNQVTFTLVDTVVTTAGEYLIYIPAETVCDESWTSNNEINLYVTVGEVAPAELAIVSATPENGSTVEALTTVEVKLNKEVGYLDKTMLIGDNGEDAHGAVLTQSADDPTVYTLDFTYDGLYENVELKKGVTYTMTLTSWASEEACNYGQGKSETVTLTYVGNSEGFKYSAITLESITPTEDFVISDKSQNKFVVKFSGPVELVKSLTYINMGQGATQEFESIVANDGQTEYTLTIAEDVLDAIRGTVSIVFAANDLDGLRVQGNNGEGEYSTFAYYFTTSIGVPALTVTPDASVEQAALNTISIGCAEGLVPSWTGGSITLTDANGNSIALNEPEAVVADGSNAWATPTEWTVTLKEELTLVGTYTLTIPAGYFNIGSTQGQVLGSRETVVVFNITAAAQGINSVVVDHEVTVYNVAGVLIANGKASEVLKNLTKGLYIVNGKKYIVK